MIDRIRIFLCLEGKRCAIFVSGKEVAAVELKAWLVGKDFDHAAGNRIFHAADKFHAVRGFVYAPIMIVSARVDKLLIIESDAFTNEVRLAEIEGRAFDRSNFACRDTFRIDGNIV